MQVNLFVQSYEMLDCKVLAVKVVGWSPIDLEGAMEFERSNKTVVLTGQRSSVCIQVWANASKRKRVHHVPILKMLEALMLPLLCCQTFPSPVIFLTSSHATTLYQFAPFILPERQHKSIGVVASKNCVKISKQGWQLCDPQLCRRLFWSWYHDRCACNK